MGAADGREALKVKVKAPRGASVGRAAPNAPPVDEAGFASEDFGNGIENVNGIFGASALGA